MVTQTSNAAVHYYWHRSQTNTQTLHGTFLHTYVNYKEETVCIWGIQSDKLNVAGLCDHQHHELAPRRVVSATTTTTTTVTTTRNLFDSECSASSRISCVSTNKKSVRKVFVDILISNLFGYETVCQPTRRHIMYEFNLHQQCYENFKLSHLNNGYRTRYQKKSVPYIRKRAGLWTYFVWNCFYSDAQCSLDSPSPDCSMFSFVTGDAM
jgi:hypothetical protein